METMTIQAAANELGLTIDDIGELAWDGELVANGDGLLSTESVVAYRHRQTYIDRLNGRYRI